MPSRFDKYRVKDGSTPLSESFFNPVFQDLDLRLVTLEEVQMSWEGEVNTLTEYGLTRINEVLAPAFAGVAATMVEVDAWKAGLVDELESWQEAMEDGLPAVEARVAVLEEDLPDKASQADLASTVAKLPIMVQPDVFGNFTISAGAVAGQLAAVAGYGLYRYDPDSTEQGDGETVVSPVSGVGRWYLIAPHWDFVWAYLAGLFDDLQAEVEAAQGAAATAQSTADSKLNASKVLTGSASLDFASIAAGAAATLTITVAGAEVGDRVVLTPPSTLPNGVVPVAYVSGTNTVTVRLNNVTSAPIDPAAMTYLVTVLKP